MAIEGSLSTIPLTDLLQWLASAGKTGKLQVERERITRVIVMREGRIVGCSSDDPPHRLGQYLLSRGKITESQLREALAAQKTSKLHLGRLLVEMGALDPDDLREHLESKAEETVFSIFDWNDAVFRFIDSDVDAGFFPLELRVEDVLLRGLARYDEMARIRQVLHDPGVVLRYTEKPPGPEIFKNKMAHAMYSAIDGERSLAEILLHVRGSEYIVYKFLFELHRNVYVEISGLKEEQTEEAATRDPPEQDLFAPEASPPATTGESPRTADGAPAGSTRAAVVTEPKTRVADAPARPTSIAGLAPDASFEERLAAARRFMTENKYDIALDLLDALYRENPRDDALRRMTAESEAAFIDRAYRHVVPEHKIPVLTRPATELATEARLSPQEFFLLSRIDGLWDVRSIIQVSPLREVDALRTLKRLRELGMIELHDPIA